MGWVADLSSLPAVVAVLVVFTVCLAAIIRYISKHVVDPFKMLIGNHLEHLTAEHKDDRIERSKMRESLEKQTRALDQQAHQFEKLCDRLTRGGEKE